jgi:hypothetical protein
MSYQLIILNLKKIIYTKEMEVLEILFKNICFVIINNNEKQQDYD